MNLRRFGAVMTAAIISALFLGANTVAARSPGAGTSQVSAIAVSGTFDDGNGPGTFSGTLDISRFDGRAGALVAVGTIDGTLTNALGITSTVEDRTASNPEGNVPRGDARASRNPLADFLCRLARATHKATTSER